MTYRGVVTNGVVLLEGEKPADGTIVEVMPIEAEFWQSPTIEELARLQDVAPLASVRALFGTWPGEADDGFEVLIDHLRHPNLAGNGGDE